MNGVRTYRDFLLNTLPSLAIFPLALIYLVREMDLAGGPTREFLVWKRRNAIRLRVTGAERRTRVRNVTEETQGTVLSLTLSERRMNVTHSGEAGEDVRGLMGMQGPVEIWIDESSRALVEIRGSAPALGPTTVLLVSFRR